MLSIASLVQGTLFKAVAKWYMLFYDLSTTSTIFKIMAFRSVLIFKNSPNYQGSWCCNEYTLSIISNDHFFNRDYVTKWYMLFYGSEMCSMTTIHLKNTSKKWPNFKDWKIHWTPRAPELRTLLVTYICLMIMSFSPINGLVIHVVLWQQWANNQKC